MDMKFLMTPGPTEIPVRVLRAMVRPAIGPGDPDYVRVWDETEELLEKLLETENYVIHFPGSGRVSIEAAMLSVLEPKDKILTVNNGVFGKWLGVIARRLGFKVVEVEVDWRRSIDVEIIKERLEREGDVKVVAVVHNETSTGVKNSIEEIGRVVKEHSALFLADTVSSTGGDTVKTDEWRIDLNCTCSYKCFGAPSGLSIVAVSDEAWETMARRRKEAGSFAFDLYRWLQMWIPPERGGKLVYGYRRHPIEPSPHMTYALNEALKVIHEEGLEKRIRRNVIGGVALRAGLRSMGLELWPLKEEYASNTVTAILPPEGLRAHDIIEIMEREHGILIGGGLEETYGKALRIAHMGITASEMHIIRTLSALEATLKRLGMKIEKNVGVDTAMEVFRREVL